MKPYFTIHVGFKHDLIKPNSYTIRKSGEYFPLITSDVYILKMHKQCEFGKNYFYCIPMNSQIIQIEKNVK